MYVTAVLYLKVDADRKTKTVVPRVFFFMCFFQDAAVAADKAAELGEFKSAQTIKINPDKPQEHARFLTLEVGC